MTYEDFCKVKIRVRIIKLFFSLCMRKPKYNIIWIIIINIYLEWMKKE